MTFFFSVYLGVNSREVHYLNEDLKGDKKYEYGVDSGLVHLDYLKTEQLRDIGLWRLDRDAVIKIVFKEPVIFRYLGVCCLVSFYLEFEYVSPKVG